MKIAVEMYAGNFNCIGIGSGKRRVLFFNLRVTQARTRLPFQYDNWGKLPPVGD